jgi:non-specific protein-tyrosine kinase
MELRRYIGIVWRWSWLLLLGTVLAGGTAYLVSRGQTRIYQATATVLVNQAQSTTGADYTSVLANQQLSKTFANLVASRPVLARVAENLALPPADLRVTASVVRDTQLIRINAQHPDPATAAAVANETAKVFAEQIRDAQGAELGTAEGDLENQAKAVQASIDEINGDIVRLNGRPPGLPEDQRLNQLAQATSRLESLRQNLSSVQRQLQDLRISVARNFNSVRLVEPATTPGAPIEPRPLLNAILAGLVGLLVAAAVVAVIEYLDDTVKSPDDVSRAVGAPTLGAIARFEPQGGVTRRGRRGVVPRLLTSLDARSPIAEAYRMVRTNLEFARSGRPNQTMLITSSSPGEGKSTTAANLALILAQTGRRVVLVDADLRRPSLHRLFDAPNTSGLSTLFVMDQPVVAGLLRLTPVENLQLLPSGPLPPNPAELLSSRRMDQIIELLKEQADLVIFDSPPLLGVADASALAGRLDGAILVVDSGRTRAGALAHAAEVLGRAQANLWGVVLNKLTARRGEGYYYYYYSYRYTPAGDEARVPQTAGAAVAPPWKLSEGDSNGVARSRALSDEPDRGPAGRR